MWVQEPLGRYTRETRNVANSEAKQTGLSKQTKSPDSTSTRTSGKILFSIPYELPGTRLQTQSTGLIRTSFLFLGRTLCSPNILRIVRRTIISFLIELLLRRTWFGLFDELCFVLNWLIMRCKLWPELAAEAQQTA